MSRSPYREAARLEPPPATADVLLARVRSQRALRTAADLPARPGEHPGPLVSGDALALLGAGFGAALVAVLVLFIFL